MAFLFRQLWVITLVIAPCSMMACQSVKPAIVVSPTKSSVVTPQSSKPLQEAPKSIPVNELYEVPNQVLPPPFCRSDENSEACKKFKESIEQEAKKKSR